MTEEALTSFTVYEAYSCIAIFARPA